LFGAQFDELENVYYTTLAKQT